jgi:FKBP-type peptidyl-prolyl cis-trans isomerase 2
LYKIGDTVYRFQKYYREDFMDTKKAKIGDVAIIHFTGKKEDDTVFGTSKDGDPIQFEIGKQGVISGLERGVIGMKPGQSKTITVPPEEAFGERKDELIGTVPKNDLPKNVTPTIGEKFKMEQENGNKIDLRIIDVEDDTVTLDANHPLAGETLELDVEMVHILR